MYAQHKDLLDRLDDAIGVAEGLTHKTAHRLLLRLVVLSHEDYCPIARRTYIRAARFVATHLEKGRRFEPGSDRGWLCHLLSQRRERLLREWGE